MNINIVFFLVLITACQLSEKALPTTSQENTKEQLDNLANMEKPQPTIDTTISLDYLLGKFDPAKDSRFVQIDIKYADQSGRLLRKETYDAFKMMANKAAEAGIKFKVLSATRNFAYQKGIWERKWTGKTQVDNQDLSKTTPDHNTRALKILEYSSMPGTSRHHWGTDLDLNSFNNAYFDTGHGKQEYDWLLANASDFGFFQPYTVKNKIRPNGYNEERWHWTYKPLSKKFTTQAGLRITENMIVGFLGSEQAASIGVVNKYIMGINPDCLN